MSKLSLAIIKYMKLYNLRDKIEKGFLNPKRNLGIFKEENFKYKYKTTNKIIDNRDLLTISKGIGPKNHIIFIHGGAYVNEGNKLQRRFIKKLIDNYDYRISYLDYPLIPEYTALDTHSYIVKGYEHIYNSYPDDELILFGNSSGGGIVLSLLITLKDLGFDTKNMKSILASPWLDAAMENKNIIHFIDKDPLLPLEGLKYTGNKYRGQLENIDYRVSPIYGNLDNLGNILMWVGSHEVFNPDCKKIYNLSKSVHGTYIDFYEIEDGFHDFIFTPIKESKEMIKLMKEFISKNS